MSEKSADPPTEPSVGCWDCSKSPYDNLQVMFINMLMDASISEGQKPARRPAFLKQHGGAHGTFEIRDLSDEEHKRLGPPVGLFAKETGVAKSFDAWVRFSSDTQPGEPDLKTTCGVAIKLFGVEGERTEGFESSTTQDFVLQNMDIFFVDNAKEMCEDTAAAARGDEKKYTDEHPVTARILKEMEKEESSVLTQNYWSVLPYQYGDDRFVKYKLSPPAVSVGLIPDDPDYLATDLSRRLYAGEARFKFMIQLRCGQEGIPEDKQTMPLDRATVRWEESESEPIWVATLVLPRQDIRTPGQGEYVDGLSFDPWRTLRVHRPAAQSTLNLARRRIYPLSARTRRYANGVSSVEPASARRPELPPPKVQPVIARAAIHPAIGIARVGDSPDEWFYGPEVIDPLPPDRERPLEPEARNPPSSEGLYRDSSGALKRQAARFRIYGLTMNGEVVKELTGSDGDVEITWGVHLANKKAAWYQFQLAQDIPEASSTHPSGLRNAVQPNREGLIIDPGLKQIDGTPGRSKAPIKCEGRFMGEPVYLGEIQTDEEGRLVVLGGHGKAGSPIGSPLTDFANNDGWYDDVSDGPVTATVKVCGQDLTVDPAWIVVAPPNYAPMQKSVRTMWDLMRDVATKGSMQGISAPARPSFVNDILPMFRRLTSLQWVNAGFAAAFGWGQGENFTDPELCRRMTSASPEEREFRRGLANQFRSFTRDSWSPQPWPWLYGDAMNVPPAKTPRQHATITDTQHTMLHQWAEGDFVDDFDDPAQHPKRTFEEVPLPEQPATLDRAALEFCLADAFHPGCEMTWVVRDPRMYMAPFRLRHPKKDAVEPAPTVDLTADLALGNGPIGPQFPGGITRWMAVPWHTDTASCRSGFTDSYNPYLPTFWPARVPNHVLTEADYEIASDSDREDEERLVAFAKRAAWPRTLGGGPYMKQVESMVYNFGRMGVVEPREGPALPGGGPDYVEVEILPKTKDSLADRPKAGPAVEAKSSVHGGVQRDPEHFDPAEVMKFNRFPRGLEP